MFASAQLIRSIRAVSGKNLISHDRGLVVCEHTRCLYWTAQEERGLGWLLNHIVTAGAAQNATSYSASLI